MPWSALPEHLNSPEKWKGTDWDNPFQRKLLKIKGWFAYGPRATQRWARWRKLPKLIFALKGEGQWRFEQDGAVEDDHGDISPFEIVGGGSEWYLTCIQYWTKWHFQLQWPFFVAFHYYIDSVPEYPQRAERKRVVYFRFGARRDSDKVYWFPSLFIGLTWN